MTEVDADLKARCWSCRTCPEPTCRTARTSTPTSSCATWGEPRAFDFRPGRTGSWARRWASSTSSGASSSRLALLRAGRRGRAAPAGADPLDARLARRRVGYTEIYPPFVVKEKALWDAGQLPKFRDNLYHDAEDDFWLVPTAEVPLTNIHGDEILAAERRCRIDYVAYTPCFRREKM